MISTGSCSTFFLRSPPLGGPLHSKPQAGNDFGCSGNFDIK
jgi:hypothetical protein